MTDFYEDVEVETRTELGRHVFTPEAIVAFASRYDPQPFHIDPVAAAQGPFGGLAASGWHTAAVWMKLYVAHRQAVLRKIVARGEPAPAPGPSPGFKALTWHRPVLAGDTVLFASTVTAKRTRTEPGWGLVFQHGTGRLEDGRPVLSFDSSVLWQRRPPG